MCKYKELFDLSNFPVSSKHQCSNNKKVVGRMKDEYGGKSIVKSAQTKVTMLLQSFKNFTIHCLRKVFLDTQ